MRVEKSKFSVGVLGAGQIVANMHLPVLLAMPEIEVAWILDVDDSKASSVGASYGIPTLPAAANPRQLPSVDIVLMGIPYGARDPIYDALRQQKCSLYVEKPFARTVEQHRRYASWFSHAHVAIGFQRRASGSARMLKGLLQRGVFGSLRKVLVEHGRPGQLTGSGYSSDFSLAGGGMLFEVGIHWIDLALYICSATAAKLENGTMRRQDSFDLHTQASFVLQSARQTDIPFEVLCSGLCETRNGIEFQFSDVTIFYSQENGKIFLQNTGEENAIELSSKMQAYPATAFQLCHAVWTDLLGSIAGGTENWTSASSSVLTTQVIENLYDLAT